MNRVLTEDEFLDALRLEFEAELDPASIVVDARLIHDLELDSLELIRVAALVESLAPIELPLQLDPFDATVGDLYYYYDLLATQVFGRKA